VSGLLARRPALRKSVSATTRPARDGERYGEDYRFLRPEEFEAAAVAGEFLEFAEVHGHRYGTPRAPVEAAIAAGDTVVLEIDVQGARSVREADPSALLIFVEPPSWDVLRARLESRKTDPPEVIEHRLANARAELAAAGDFDHRVVNDDLEGAISQVVRIIEGAE